MNCRGYRGYIGSRMGERSVPQNIQQMVIRDYCKTNNLHFLLSATEYMMEDSTMILDALLREDIDGIVMYSIYLMPTDKAKRDQVYNSKKDICFAAENLTLTEEIKEVIETTIVINKYHARNQLPEIITQLHQA